MQQCGGSHDDEGLPPGGPHLGQPDPKEPIAPSEFWPVHRPLVDGQLLPQGEVLEGELAVAADEEGQEPVKNLAAGRSIGEGQGAPASASKRVVLRIVPEKVISWDPRKLGGRYCPLAADRERPHDNCSRRGRPC